MSVDDVSDLAAFRKRRPDAEGEPRSGVDADQSTGLVTLIDSRLRAVLEAMLPARPVRHFVANVGNRWLFIKTADVDWIEADGNYIRLHCEKSSFRLRLTLSAVAERLDSSAFLRIHKSCVVKVDAIREVQSWYGGDYIAILHSGKQLRVSRTYARALLRQMR